MKIDIVNFEGLQPKLAAHLLRDVQAQIALNARCEKGDLRAWAAGSVKKSLSTATYKSLYQYLESTNKHWITSTNDRDYVPNPIANDIFERLYFTGESEPRAFVNDLINGGFDPASDYYKIGPAKPTTAPTIDAGYTTNGNYRAYVYTYVTRYGEETGPSPVASITDYGSGNVTLSSFTQPPAGYALRTKVGTNYPKIRVYRVMTSVTGAEFQYVNEFEISTGVFNFGTGTFTDNVSDANLGEVLPTEKYEGINSNLKGLVSTEDGIFAGFYGNVLYISEPYQPHAWPDEYQMVFDYDIIGLGVKGNTIIVMTKGTTHIVFGNTPETLAKDKLAGFYPCISKRGIVSTDDGILYPSYQGLIRVTEQSLENILAAHLTPKEWSAYNPELMNGHYYNNKYFGFSSTSAIVFDTFQQIFTTIGDVYDTGYVSVDEGKFYTILNNKVEEWEGDPYNFKYYKWMSKKFLLPQDTGFTCGQVIVDLDTYNTVLQAMSENTYLQGLNTAIYATGDLEDTWNYGSSLTKTTEWNEEDWNGSALYDLASVSISSAINFKLFVDNVQIMEKSVTSDWYFRLAAKRGRRVEIQLEGYIPVRRVTLAQSPREVG